MIGIMKKIMTFLKIIYMEVQKKYGGNAKKDMNGKQRLEIELTEKTGCPICYRNNRKKNKIKNTQS